MYNLEAIKKYNGTTAADIEGGSFIIRDGVRVPITAGVAGRQIDELEKELSKQVEYQPKTGQRCSCKRGTQRDNCSQCEGTGWRIDFAAIRDRRAY